MCSVTARRQNFADGPAPGPRRRAGVWAAVPAAMGEPVDAWAGPDSFEEALTKASGGDERSFAALWRWANPSLLRWLRVVAPDGGEDLASEVWMSVVRALDSFRGTEPEFRAWFFTIARRRAIDAGRRRQRRPQVVGLDGVDACHPIDMSE